MGNIKDLAIIKTARTANDWLVLQDDSNNQTYRIKASNFVAGLAASSAFNYGNDANYSNRLLLLKGNGTDGQSTFTDNSSYNRTITNQGSPIITTSQSRFDGSSIYFDGASSLSMPSASELSIGNGDFTIQAWIQPLSVTGSRVILDRYSASVAWSWWFGLNGNKLRFVVRSSPADSNWTDITGSVSLPLLQWSYVGVRVTVDTVIHPTNKSLVLWVNGARDGSATHTISLNSSLPLTVGRSQVTANNYFYGYLDDLRFSNRSEDLSIIPGRGFPISV
ncbi:LamG domain-containing protein [Nostoc linckia FACHB-104]|nr:LamG domain-containing protein [Nostoc linckia FACHB-104]